MNPLARTQPTLDAGSLVHLAGTPVTPYTVRVVVAVEPDGSCVTAYASPAPWLTESEDRLYRDRLAELRPVDPELARALRLVCA